MGDGVRHLFVDMSAATVVWRSWPRPIRWSPSALLVADAGERMRGSCLICALKICDRNAIGGEVLEIASFSQK